MSRKYNELREAVAWQFEWMVSHGETLEGYVARYGSRNDPERYGDGGEAIYAADFHELEKRTLELARYMWRRQNSRRWSVQ